MSVRVHQEVVDVHQHVGYVTEYPFHESLETGWAAEEPLGDVIQ